MRFSANIGWQRKKSEGIYWEFWDLTIHDVMKGTRVSIEYTPLPYGGKKPKENDEGFTPSCALKLYSITVLEMTNESVRLDTSHQ